ncbi:type 2 periplasmic-binding domain-containing protein [Cohnella abietis]|uniref:ABC transporter substrate-binding protein n=1 Tax=Cohnella abietis TaxID=2507935 RepID=A0A3T1D083_9BACL|nr:extracellular solute-binding protein [Cohnella abietis]BBI31506.1 ABC transporter substrate-binding protein [Cohnella abietis]
MRKIKQSLSLVVCMLLVMSVLAACSSSNKEKDNSTPAPSTGTESASPTSEASPGEVSTDPISFDMFVNFSWYSLSWADPAAKSITSKTGVTLNITKPVSDDNQKMNIMLSNRQLPDFVLLDKTDPALQRMIEGGLLYSLEELIDQYAPEMRDVLPKEALANYKAADGKTYALVSFIEGEQYVEAAKKYNALVGSNQPTWSIRQDYWEEIGKPDISNPDAYIAAMEQIKAKHKNKIGFYTNANNVPNAKHLNVSAIVGLGTANQFGVQPLIKEGDALKSGLRSTEYQNVIKFLNKLSTKGILTKDSFIDTKDIFTQKINNGDAVSYAFTIGDGTKVPADNSSTSYAVMAPFDSYKQVRDGSGWTAIAIPKTNKDPKRAIQFLSFLSSEEGHKLTKWGVEGDTYVDAAQGPHYHMVDGKATYLPAYWADKQKDWNGVAEKNGLSEYWLTANSTWWNGPEWDATDKSFIEYNKMFGDHISYDPTLVGLELEPTSKLGIMEKKIIDLYASYYSKIIFAKDEAAALALYAEFIEKADKVGLAEIEQAWTDTYKAKMANR